MPVQLERSDSIRKILMEVLPNAKVSSDTDESDGAVTFQARAGLTEGLDVRLEGEKAVVEWSTRIGTFAMSAIVASAFVLTYLFGGPILAAMGLVADAGGASLTLKIAYVIPLLIFLTPLGILWALVSKLVPPRDEALLARVVERMAALGIEASVEGRD